MGYNFRRQHSENFSADNMNLISGSLSGFTAFRVYSWLIITAIFLFTSCEQTEPSRTELALGTVCSVTLFDQGKKSVYDAIFSGIRETENLMSVNIQSSDISLINSNAGIAAVQVNEETFKVTERALFFARRSAGSFDPSVGPIVSLWGIGTEEQNVPPRDKINQIQPLVDWQNVEMHPDSRGVFLKQRGMALDLGAIAKGYAADKAARLAREAGIKRAIIDLGGNIVVIGVKKDKSPWRIGIQAPGGNRGETAGYLQITGSNEKNTSVVTSGVYERCFTEDGQLYHHIFSPSLGYPVQNGLVSVTIIAESSTDADALSTSVFVSGYEKGMALLEPPESAGAVFIFEDKSVIVTPGVDFTLTDNAFYIKK